MILYLVTYSCVARNVSPAVLVTALAAIPHDVDTETLLGLVPLADNTTSSGVNVTRSMSYTSAPGAIIPDPQLGQFLRNYYTSTFAQALSTSVVASAVSTATVPVAPLVWLRADAGAEGPVATWFDLSGHGNNFAQATGGLQPAIGIGPSGEIVVHFAAPNQLVSAGALSFDSFSYVVTQQSPLLATPGILVERSVNSTANNGESIFQSQPESILARRSGTTHFANDTEAPVWGVTGSFELVAFTYTFSGASPGGNLFVDDMTIPAAAFAALPAHTFADNVYLGARGLAQALPITGAVRELFIFSEALSTDDLNALAPYMRAQVGL